MNTPTKSFKFLFVGYKRTWNPLEGHAAPNADWFWEVRSLPGNVFSTGASFDEACTNLTKQLDLCFPRVGGVQKWYESALQKLSEQDRDQLLDYFFRSEDFKKADSGFQYAPVHEERAAIPA